MALINIPTLLRGLTGGQASVEMTLAEEPVSVRQILERLDSQFPGLAERLLYEDDLLPGIAVFVNGEQTLLGLREKVSNECQIDFIPPPVGG